MKGWVIKITQKGYRLTAVPICNVEGQIFFFAICQTLWNIMKYMLKIPGKIVNFIRESRYVFGIH